MEDFGKKWLKNFLIEICQKKINAIKYWIKKFGEKWELERFEKIFFRIKRKY